MRTIVMTDAESERLTELADLRKASRSETVNQLVDEESRRCAGILEKGKTDGK